MRIAERVYLVGSEQFGLSHPLDCNCYLIDAGSCLALLDTGLGLGVDDLLSNIAKEGFKPEKLTHILITHSHIGHWGGCNELRSRTGAQVWAPALGAYAMTHVEDETSIRINLKLGRYPAEFVPHPCTPDATFADRDRIRIGEIMLQAIQVQGHTKDSTCFLMEEGATRLFTGDTVFYAGKIGLLNLAGCSLDDYRRDIHKLAALRVDSLFPGHGVFVVKGGYKHIKRAVHKLSDFVLPETFFEVDEFMWDREYLDTMTK